MLDKTSLYDPMSLMDRFFRARVIDNVDPTNQGRVKLSIPRLMINNRPDEEPISPKTAKRKLSANKIQNKEDNTFHNTIQKVNFIWARPLTYINSISVEKTVTSKSRYCEPDDIDKTLQEVKIGEDLKKTTYVPCSGELKIPRIGTNIYAFFEDGDIKKCYYLPFGPTLENDYIAMDTVENKTNADTPNKRVNIDVMRAWHNGSIMYYDTNDDANVWMFRTQNGHRIKVQYNAKDSDITINTEKGHTIRLVDKSNDDGTWHPYDNNNEDMFKAGSYISVQTARGHKFLMDDNPGREKIHISTIKGHIFDLVDCSNTMNGSVREKPYYSNDEALQTNCSYIKATTTMGSSFMLFDKSGITVQDLFPEEGDELVKDASSPSSSEPPPVKVGYIVTCLPLPANIKFQTVFSPLLASINVDSVNAIKTSPLPTVNVLYSPIDEKRNPMPFFIPTPPLNTLDGIKTVKSWVLNYLSTGVNQNNPVAKPLMVATGNPDNDYTLKIDTSGSETGIDLSTTEGGNYHEITLSMGSMGLLNLLKGLVPLPDEIMDYLGGGIFYWKLEGLMRDPTVNGKLDIVIKDAVEKTLFTNIPVVDSDGAWEEPLFLFDTDKKILKAGMMPMALIYKEVENMALAQAEVEKLKTMVPQVSPPWLLACAQPVPMVIPDQLIDAINTLNKSVDDPSVDLTDVCKNLKFDSEESIKTSVTSLVNVAEVLEEESSPSVDTMKHIGLLEMTGKPFIQAITVAGNRAILSDFLNTFEISNIDGAYIRAISGLTMELNTPGNIIVTAGQNISVQSGLVTSVTAGTSIIEQAPVIKLN